MSRAKKACLVNISVSFFRPENNNVWSKDVPGAVRTPFTAGPMLAELGLATRVYLAARDSLEGPGESLWWSSTLFLLGHPFPTQNCVLFVRCVLFVPQVNLGSKIYFEWLLAFIAKSKSKILAFEIQSYDPSFYPLERKVNLYVIST